MKQLTDSLQEKFGEFADRCAKFARDVLSFKGFFGKLFALVVFVVIGVLVVAFLVVWMHFSYVVTRLFLAVKLCCCFPICKLFKLCGSVLCRSVSACCKSSRSKAPKKMKDLEALEAQHQAEDEVQKQPETEDQDQSEAEVKDLKQQKQSEAEVKDLKLQKQPKAGVKYLKPQKQPKAKARISKN